MSTKREAVGFQPQQSVTSASSSAGPAVGRPCCRRRAQNSAANSNTSVVTARCPTQRRSASRRSMPRVLRAQQLTADLVISDIWHAHLYAGAQQGFEPRLTGDGRRRGARPRHQPQRTRVEENKPAHVGGSRSAKSLRLEERWVSIARKTSSHDSSPSSSASVSATIATARSPLPACPAAADQNPPGFSQRSAHESSQPSVRQAAARCQHRQQTAAAQLATTGQPPAPACPVGRLPDADVRTHLVADPGSGSSYR
jgi:hypothetical protein